MADTKAILLDKTISLTDAQARIQLWQDQHPGDIKAFTFTVNELNQLMTLINNHNSNYNPETDVIINGVRFYLGINRDLPPDGSQACLIAVSVEGFNGPAQEGGNDVYEYIDQTIDNTGHVIFDFSFPCPTTCPQSGIMPECK